MSFISLKLLRYCRKSRRKLLQRGIGDVLSLRDSHSIELERKKLSYIRSDFCVGRGKELSLKSDDTYRKWPNKRPPLNKRLLYAFKIVLDAPSENHCKILGISKKEQNH